MRTMLAALLLAALFSWDQDPAPAAPPQRLFAVVFRTGPAWDQKKPPSQQSFFKEHSQNLAALRKAERIALGGRYADVGLIVVRAADFAEARSLMSGDPSLAAGVFQAEVHPWSTIYEGCTSAPPTPR